MAEVSKETVELVNRVTKWYSAPTGTVPLADSISEEDAVGAAIGAADTYAGMAEMVGKKAPVLGTFATAGSLALNAENLRAEYGEGGTISQSTFYATASDVTGIMTGLGVGAAATVGFPAVATVAAVGTVAWGGPIPLDSQQALRSKRALGAPQASV
ncbi:hypothetical protein, partial [Thiohalorhabdus methylotrophus]